MAGLSRHVFRLGNSNSNPDIPFTSFLKRHINIKQFSPLVGK
jgi:hypothetical protein